MIGGILNASIASPGMFNPNKTIGEQRCTPPGERLGVKLELDADRRLKLAPDSGQPSSDFELQVMLQGGHRNRVTRPVSHTYSLSS